MSDHPKNGKSGRGGVLYKVYMRRCHSVATDTSYNYSTTKTAKLSPLVITCMYSKAESLHVFYKALNNDL